MTRAAPVAAWAIATILTLPTVYTMGEAAVAPEFHDVWPVDPAVSQRITEFFAVPAPPHTRRGVLLGTSGGFCIFGLEPATPDDSVQVLTIATLGQGLQVHYPYIDQILAQRPDFILIQSPVLLIVTGPPPLYEIARRHLRKGLLGPAIETPGVYWARPDSTPPACRTYAGPETWNAEIVSETGKVTHDRSDPATEWAESAMASLVGSGIPVFLFNQPRNEYSAPYHDVVDREVDEMLAAMGTAGRRVTTLRYPEILPMALFYDPFHLVPAGAALYRRRLLADVIASLDAGPAPR